MDCVVIKGGKFHRGKRWGRVEVFLLGLGVVAAGTAVGSYLTLVRNERRAEVYEERLRQSRETVELLRERVKAIESSAKVETPTAESIRASLRTFEEEYLADNDLGFRIVISQVNQMARESGVTLSEITFSAIEEGEVEGRLGVSPVGRARGFYPGLRMSFTVTGDYAKIRKFLAELERSRTLLIIESLALKSVEERAVTQRGAGQATTLISLEIRLSVYFRREGSL